MSAGPSRAVVSRVLVLVLVLVVVVAMSRCRDVAPVSAIDGAPTTGISSISSSTMAFARVSVRRNRARRDESGRARAPRRASAASPRDVDAACSRRRASSSAR
jgi:hypothetical protein